MRYSVSDLENQAQYLTAIVDRITDIERALARLDINGAIDWAGGYPTYDPRYANIDGDTFTGRMNFEGGDTGGINVQNSRIYGVPDPTGLEQPVPLGFADDRYQAAPITTEIPMVVGVSNWDGAVGFATAWDIPAVAGRTKLVIAGLQVINTSGSATSLPKQLNSSLLPAAYRPTGDHYIVGSVALAGLALGAAVRVQSSGQVSLHQIQDQGDWANGQSLGAFGAWLT